MQASQLKLTSPGTGPGPSLEDIFQNRRWIACKKIVFWVAFDSAAWSLPEPQRAVCPKGPENPCLWEPGGKVLDPALFSTLDLSEEP